MQQCLYILVAAALTGSVQRAVIATSAHNIPQSTPPAHTTIKPPALQNDIRQTLRPFFEAAVFERQRRYLPTVWKIMRAAHDYPTGKWAVERVVDPAAEWICEHPRTADATLATLVAANVVLWGREWLRGSAHS